MPRELTDEEFAYLQGRRQVADFVESIYQDPKLNREAKALIKKKYPQLQIPDYDLEQRVTNTFAQEKKKRDDEEAAKKQKADEEKWAEQRKKARETYGFTEEGFKKVEDLMIEKNIPDYDVAASYVAAREPKASDAEYGNTWDFSKKEIFKEISNDPEDWARRELLKAARIDEQRLKGRG